VQTHDSISFLCRKIYGRFSPERVKPLSVINRGLEDWNNLETPKQRKCKQSQVNFLHRSRWTIDVSDWSSSLCQRLSGFWWRFSDIGCTDRSPLWLHHALGHRRNSPFESSRRNYRVSQSPCLDICHTKSNPSCYPWVTSAETSLYWKKRWASLLNLKQTWPFIVLQSARSLLW
jgi:hypothetical protein